MKIPDVISKKHSGLLCQNYYSFARKNKGVMIKDFHCAIPKNFPSNNRYERSRVFINDQGEEFVKTYALEGNFKQTDEDHRLLLTSYWKIVDGKNLSFRFDEKDFLRFKGVNPNQTENINSLKDYLKRTEINRWLLNFWRDHKRGKFRKGEKSYGIIQSTGFLEVESETGEKTVLREVTWTQDYYDALIYGENWKYFDFEVYTSLSEEQQLAKKLLRFFGEGNNEFIMDTTESENITIIHFKIEIELLCTFYLAQIEQPRWRYKDTLKKPLNTLKEKGKLLFDNVKNCFTKSEGQTYLEVDYILKSKQPSSIQNKNQTNIIDCIEENQELLDKLIAIKIHPENAKEFVAKYSKEDIEQALEIVKNRKSNEEIRTPSAHFASILKRPEKPHNPVKQKINSHKTSLPQWEQPTKKEQVSEKRKKQEAIEAYQKMTNEERWNHISKNVLLKHDGFQQMSTDQQNAVKENTFKNVFLKSRSMGLAEGRVLAVVREIIGQERRLGIQGI